MRDAVLPADPVEHHLTAAAVESRGELLAVVGEYLLGHPEPLQSLNEGLAADLLSKSRYKLSTGAARYRGARV